jgi:hypothetical protein
MTGMLEAAADVTVTVSGRTGAGGRGCADAVPESVAAAISDDVAIERHLSARLLLWCIGDLPGNQTDGVRRLTALRADLERGRRALYKEPPQRNGGTGNTA